MMSNVEAQDLSSAERLIFTEAVSGVVAAVSGLFAVESFFAYNPDWRPESALAGVCAAVCVVADTQRRH